MPDSDERLSHRLRELDHLPSPDLWDRIETTQPGATPRLGSGRRRAVAAVVALTLAASGLVIGTRAFLGRDRAKPAAGSVTGSPQPDATSPTGEFRVLRHWTALGDAYGFAVRPTNHGAQVRLFRGVNLDDTAPGVLAPLENSECPVVLTGTGTSVDGTGTLLWTVGAAQPDVVEVTAHLRGGGDARAELIPLPAGLGAPSKGVAVVAENPSVSDVYPIEGLTVRFDDGSVQELPDGGCSRG